jgi:hypothetical protein
VRRVATRSRLPGRPSCPRCQTQFAPVVLYQSLSSAADVVVLTDSCKHLRRDTRQRCGLPFAVVVRSGQPPEYVTAETWALLEVAIGWVRHPLEVCNA